MRTTNERCPLQAECERSCEFQHRELECSYYRDNARDNLLIEDQEKIRKERARESEYEMWEAAMAELPEDDLEEDKPRDIEARQAETPHTLDELASDIRAFSGSILFSAIEIGRRMVEAKKMLPHGEFGKWVKEKTGYSQTKANNFMRLFREYGSAQNGILEAGENYHTYGNLSYSNALALLDLPSDERNSFVEENNVIDMSARELDKAIRERKEALAAAEEARANAKAAEDARAKMEADMTMLKGLLESAKAETASATEEAVKLARELEDLKAKPVEVAVMQVDQEALDKARAEAVAGMQDMLRNSDKQKIFKMIRTSSNEGVIDDSGSTTPYSIMKDLTALSTATAGSDAKPTMIYGDPANYLLGLFGGFTIRIDESYKAAERMHTILGDVFVGGNVVVDKGFVIANLPKSGS